MKFQVGSHARLYLNTGAVQYEYAQHLIDSEIYYDDVKILYSEMNAIGDRYMVEMSNGTVVSVYAHNLTQLVFTVSITYEHTNIKKLLCVFKSLRGAVDHVVEVERIDDNIFKNIVAQIEEDKTYDAIDHRYDIEVYELGA